MERFDCDSLPSWTGLLGACDGCVVKGSGARSGVRGVEAQGCR
jgi:hypothetical protein